MAEVAVSQLKQAIESQHGRTATLTQSVPIKKTFGGKMVWEAVTCVFKISDHPKAHRAYAWSSPIDGSDKRRLVAALHLPPVISPVDAARAAVVSEHKAATVGRGK